MKKETLIKILEVLLAIVAGAAILMTLMNRFGSSTQNSAAKVEWCDETPNQLCIESFGTDDQNRMILYFRLPNPEYPSFFVKGSSEVAENLYSCEKDAADPTLIRCYGPRTPLGAPLNITVFSRNGETTLAEGKFIVAALIVEPSTTSPVVPSTDNNTLPATQPLPTPSVTTATPSIAGTAYPNP